MTKEFEMILMGELKFFLGLQIIQEPEGIFINQSKYIRFVEEVSDGKSQANQCSYENINYLGC